MSNASTGNVAANVCARSAFTLLEVLLALSLASLVLIALTTAVDVQLRVVDTSRGDVEEAQLARVLLHRIADELRAAVLTCPINYDELTSGSGSSGSGSSGSGSSGSASGESEEASGEEASDEEESSFEDLGLEDTEDLGLGLLDEDLAASGVPQSTPGVYGGSDWIQIDAGRSPRLEQLEALSAPADESAPAAPVGNVKTITYYVRSPEEAGIDYGVEGTESGGGLVRRESDRALALYASQEGVVEETDLDVPPIAPEVVAIEFWYSDGSEWLDSWDTSVSGGLPVAVEIVLTVRRTRSRRDRLASSSASEADLLGEEDVFVQRLVVHLPAAQASSGGSGYAGSSQETSGATGETSGTTGVE